MNPSSIGPEIDLECFLIMILIFPAFDPSIALISVTFKVTAVGNFSLPLAMNKSIGFLIPFRITTNFLPRR